MCKEALVASFIIHFIIRQHQTLSESRVSSTMWKRVNYYVSLKRREIEIGRYDFANLAEILKLSAKCCGSYLPKY